MAQIRALVIGVDAAAEQTNGGNGFDRDARRFTSLLTDTLGFDPTEVRLLVNRRATRRDVVASLHWLLSDVSDDDIRVLYFSGLGFRLPGDGLLREVLVLYDGGYLFDNEISFLTRQLPPRAISIVLDTCFEGGLEQRLVAPELGAIKAWQPKYSKLDLLHYRERFARVTEFKPFGCEPAPVSRADLLEMHFGTPIALPVNHSRMNATLLKACQHHEVAVAGGICTSEVSAFTFALCRLLESRGGFVTSQEVVDGTAGKLAAMGVSQTPQYLNPTAWGSPESHGFIAQSPIEATAGANFHISGAPANPGSGGTGERLGAFLRLVPSTVEGIAQTYGPGSSISRRQVPDQSE